MVVAEFSTIYERMAQLGVELTSEQRAIIDNAQPITANNLGEMLQVKAESLSSDQPNSEQLKYTRYDNN